MSAIRLARGATGRDQIIKFEGCYHGHADSLLVKAGSGALTFGHPSSAGVPADVIRRVDEPGGIAGEEKELRAGALAAALRAAHLPGVLDVAPAYASVCVRHAPAAADARARLVAAISPLVDNATPATAPRGKAHPKPARYSSGHPPFPTSPSAARPRPRRTCNGRA